jgi:hypothetical protein
MKMQMEETLSEVIWIKCRATDVAESCFEDENEYL